MKNELQQKLLKKYPEFFSHINSRKIYTGEKSVHQDVENLLDQKDIVLPIQFGFEVGDGWYVLLDELMNSIQSYIKAEANSNKYQPRYVLIRMLHHSLSNSRFKHFRSLGYFIFKYAPKRKAIPIKVYIDQVKEKFGGLRFYYHGGDDMIDGMVSFAESLSYRICEFCGSSENVGHTNGWIFTVCKNCMKTNDHMKNRIWIPIE
jgi:hypothetical protein